MTTSFEQWVTTSCRLTSCRLDYLPGDASFRRYARVQHANQTWIAMDASAEKNSCVPFAAIATALRRSGLHAPQVIASDFERGFLLLSDLGDRVLLRELTEVNALQYYQRALDALRMMQQVTLDDFALKLFTAEFMYQELQLFREWFLQKHLALTLDFSTQKMLDHTFLLLAESAASQPRVFMHRDFHSANLMLLPDDEIGILDFQDAFMGPVTYDLVSLLRDCYIAWPEQMVQKWLHSFHEKMTLPGVSYNQLTHWFDWMGLQRHMKALLTFSRKFHRDNNSNYLQHIPRTLNYILTISERYAETRQLHQFLTNVVAEKCVE